MVCTRTIGVWFTCSVVLWFKQVIQMDHSLKIIRLRHFDKVIFERFRDFIRSWDTVYDAMQIRFVAIIKQFPRYLIVTLANMEYNTNKRRFSLIHDVTLVSQRSYWYPTAILPHLLGPELWQTGPRGLRLALGSLQIWLLPWRAVALVRGGLH